jgi:hypothetical protein
MDEIELNNKKYVSTRQASSLTGYTNDYIGQLCREKKVDATRIGRSWYVSEDSIIAHKNGTPSIEVKKAEKKEKLEESEFVVPITKHDIAIQNSLYVEEIEDVEEVEESLPVNSQYLEDTGKESNETEFKYDDEKLASYNSDPEPLLPPLNKIQEDLSPDTNDEEETVSSNLVPTTPSPKTPVVHSSMVPVPSSTLLRFKKIGIIFSFLFLFAATLFAFFDGTQILSFLKGSVAFVVYPIVSVIHSGILEEIVIAPLSSAASAINIFIDDTIFTFLYGSLF